MTTDHVFRTASVTKLFTGGLVMQLIESGKLKLAARERSNHGRSIILFATNSQQNVNATCTRIRPALFCRRLQARNSPLSYANESEVRRLPFAKLAALQVLNQARNFAAARFHYVAGVDIGTGHRRLSGQARRLADQIRQE